MINKLFGGNNRKVAELSEQISKLRQACKESAETIKQLSATVKKLQKIEGALEEESRQQLFEQFGQRIQKVEKSMAEQKVSMVEYQTKNSQQWAAPLHHEIETLKLIAGRVAAGRSRALPPHSSLSEAEFNVFSVNGEDGILQFLLQHVPVSSQTFVEFAVDDYSSAATRFLLMNDHWKGFVMDGSGEKIAALQNSGITWRYNLSAKAVWLTAENINDAISASGISNEIGVLSVDVKGADYWLWKALSVTRPCIVVCRHNPLLGAQASVTVPYNPEFRRHQAHPSGAVHGASIVAMEEIGKEKGYRLVGGSVHGNTLFFVREDLARELPARNAAEVWQLSRFVEVSGPDGQPVQISFDEAKELTGETSVLDTRTGQTSHLKDF